MKLGQTDFPTHMPVQPSAWHSFGLAKMGRRRITRILQSAVGMPSKRPVEPKQPYEVGAFIIPHPNVGGLRLTPQIAWIQNRTFGRGLTEAQRTTPQANPINHPDAHRRFPDMPLLFRDGVTITDSMPSSILMGNCFDRQD